MKVEEGRRVPRPITRDVAVESLRGEFEGRVSVLLLCKKSKKSKKSAERY